MVLLVSCPGNHPFHSQVQEQWHPGTIQGDGSWLCICASDDEIQWGASGQCYELLISHEMQLRKIKGLWGMCSDWKVLTPGDSIHGGWHCLDTEQSLCQLGHILEPNMYKFNGHCEERLLMITSWIETSSHSSGQVRMLCPWLLHKKGVNPQLSLFSM